MTVEEKRSTRGQPTSQMRSESATSLNQVIEDESSSRKRIPSGIYHLVTISERSRFPTHPLSSFHNDHDIYNYKFTKGLFWVSQICALLVVVLFYCFNFSTQESLFLNSSKTLSVIAAAIGSAIILLIWLLLGLIFNKLFRIRTRHSAVDAVVGVQESGTKSGGAVQRRKEPFLVKDMPDV